MDRDDERNLPLHDEAAAREKWRGGETLLDKGHERLGLPASEVDDAAASEGEAAPGSAPGALGPGLRPPD